MNIREQMERVYSDIPLENIPWNMSEPPQMLVEAVESGKIKPCRVVDLGCGAGNYSVWLAEHRFEVTGLDISRQAIKFADELAARKKVLCTFTACDLLGDLTEFEGDFDLALDWEVLHHIFPEDRSHYVKNVHSLLRPGGVYFSVCFSESDASFGGEGKFRETPLGTTLYFSSEEELRDLLVPSFDILELNIVEIPGKRGPHMVNVIWAERK